MVAAAGRSRSGDHTLPNCTNAEDQLRGEGVTLPFFSRGRFRNPMVVRVAGLAYQRGFGGHFHNDNALGVLRDIPGLVVACPARADDAAGMLRSCVAAAITDATLSVFLEPIALYHRRDLYADGDGSWLAADSGAIRHRRSRWHHTKSYDHLTLGNGCDDPAGCPAARHRIGATCSTWLARPVRSPTCWHGSGYGGIGGRRATAGRRCRRGVVAAWSGGFPWDSRVAWRGQFITLATAAPHCWSRADIEKQPSRWDRTFMTSSATGARASPMLATTSGTQATVREF